MAMNNLGAVNIRNVERQACGHQEIPSAGSRAPITGHPPTTHTHTRPHQKSTVMDIADWLVQNQFPPLSSVASYTAEAGELKSTFPTFLDVIYVLPTRCLYIRPESRTEIRVEGMWHEAPIFAGAD